MGAAKNAKHEAKDAARRRRASGNPATSKRATWENADADLLWRAVCVVSDAGGAIRFGLTSDGGAYAVGIYDDGLSKEYLRPEEDLNEYLRGVIEDYS